MDLDTAMARAGAAAAMTPDDLRRERRALDEAYRASPDYVAPAIAARLAPPIPPRFAEATLVTFDADTPALRAALAAVRQWGDRVLAGKPAMLALVGSQGTGKSHQLYAAARGLVAAGVRVWHRPWYRLADELRYGGADAFTGTKLEPADVRAALYRERVVLLDEVRPTAGTAFDDTELTKFACHAYDQCAAVLLTTNVSPLADVMGPPAASRFTQVTVVGADRRQSPPSR